MKKMLSIILIIVTFLIIYFLQSNFFNWFNILDIKPNLFIIFAVFLGLFLGEEYGFAWGILLGLLLDLFIGKNIGIHSISLGVVGLISGILNKNFSRGNRFTIMLIVIFLTLLSETINYFLDMIINGGIIDFINFTRMILIEILYNVIIVIIIYPIFQKAGNALEAIFSYRRAKIRYF